MPDIPGTAELCTEELFDPAHVLNRVAIFPRCRFGPNELLVR
ncbi:MAG TPA: hypothetical protein VFM91_00035 [Propionibacteriaceae bacterium]|nr:hypothetical protein [Propionibacteriaceae bacterium]